MYWIKEKLQTLFGGVVGIIFYLIILVFVLVPILYLDLNFWITMLLFWVVQIPGIGNIVSIIAYIKSFPIVLQDGINFFSVCYYISLVVSALPMVINFLMMVFKMILNIIVSIAHKKD